MAVKAKKKRSFLDGYKTYDDSEGRGSKSEWRKSFGNRMGLDEARIILGDDDPLSIFRLQMGASPDEIKKAWRREALRWHPDRNNGCEESAKRFMRAKAAYVKLTEVN